MHRLEIPVLPGTKLVDFARTYFRMTPEKNQKKIHVVHAKNNKVLMRGYPESCPVNYDDYLVVSAFETRSQVRVYVKFDRRYEE